MDAPLLDEIKKVLFPGRRADERKCRLLDWLGPRLVTPMDAEEEEEGEGPRRLELITQLLVHLDWDDRVLNSLPDALALPLRLALITCRTENTANLGRAANRLIGDGRADGVMHTVEQFK